MTEETGTFNGGSDIRERFRSMQYQCLECWESGRENFEKVSEDENGIALKCKNCGWQHALLKR